MQTLTLSDVMASSRALAEQYPGKHGPQHNRGCFGSEVLKHALGNSASIRTFIEVRNTPVNAFRELIWVNRVGNQIDRKSEEVIAVLNHMMCLNDQGHSFASCHAGTLKYAEKYFGFQYEPEPEEEEPMAAEVKPSISFVDKKGTKLFGFLPVGSWFKKDPMDKELAYLLEQANQKSEEKTLTSV